MRNNNTLITFGISSHAIAFSVASPKEHEIAIEYLYIVQFSNIHYGKLDVCRVLNLLPSVFFRALGK